MKIYSVKQKYYDSGKVEATIDELEAPYVLENVKTAEEKYDLYIDYFADKTEAKKFFADIRRL